MLNINSNNSYFNNEELQYYKNYLDNANNIDSLHDENKDMVICNRILKKGELIGEGGFSKVYKAFDETEGILVAIKELKINVDDSNQIKIV